MLIHWYRIANFLYRHKIPFLPTLIYYMTRFVFRCSVPYSVKIGKGCKFGYGGIALVIHARAVIGCNCTISQCVTIGGTSQHYEVPKIGNNVQINAGAKIIGPITVGDNVVIGANAVVVKDVPNNCVVVGVPAKIIKRNINIEDY